MSCFIPSLRCWDRVPPWLFKLLMPVLLLNWKEHVWRVLVVLYLLRCAIFYVDFQELPAANLEFMAPSSTHLAPCWGRHATLEPRWQLPKKRIQNQNHGLFIWTPNLESLNIRYIPSQNQGPYFKPHANKEETGYMRVQEIAPLTPSMPIPEQQP